MRAYTAERLIHFYTLNEVENILRPIFALCEHVKDPNKLMYMYIYMSICIYIKM